MNEVKKGHQVLKFFANPHEDDDCCDTSQEFDTLEACREWLRSDPGTSKYPWFAIDSVELDELEYHESKDYDHKDDDGCDWKSEWRMQHAMAFGVQGWNDYPGW